MTLSSMTGFGRAQGAAGGFAWAWEARSVNGRGLDLRLRLPGGFEVLDQPVRKLAGALLVRGNVSLNLQVQRERGDARYLLNRDWLGVVTDAARRIREMDGGNGFGLIQPEGLLALRGVIESVDDAADTVPDDATQKTLLAGAEEALEALAEARRSEGAALYQVLSEHLNAVERLAASARETAATQPHLLQERMLRTIRDLMEQLPALPAERIAQEVAMLAAKADVREELDRLEAHISAGRDLLDSGKPCGRKLEFLAQEFHREANTLGSKSHDIELTRIGLDLKAAIDQIREQVANVE